MIASFQTWWIGRALREKRLILVMLTLMAIVVVWLGILRPVAEGLADARAAHLSAVDRAARVKAGLALLQATEAPAAAFDGPLDQVIARSALEAGFMLESNTAAGADGVSIAIGSARAPALLGWLGSMEAHGLVVDTATIQSGANRTVSAKITLGRPGR